MTPSRQLAWVALTVLAVDVAVHWPREAVGPTPVVLPFRASTVDRVEVGTVGAPTVLERRADGWRLAHGERADEGAVEALVAALDGGLTSDVRWAERDPRALGLAGGRERRLALFAGEEAVVDLVVGDDAGAGHTWVRAAGTERVSQVRLGGRARLEGDWVDRRLWPLATEDVEQLVVAYDGAAPWTATREDGAWFGIDGAGVERLLARLRSARVRRWGVALPDTPPRLALTVAPAGTLRVWPAREGLDGVVVERVSDEGAVRALVRPADVAWVDALPSLRLHSLYRLPWQAIRRVEVEGPHGRGVLVGGPDGWSIVQPAGLAGSPRRLEAVARFAAAPRLLGPPGGVAPVVAASRVWRITTPTGDRVLRFGDATPQGVPVRTADGTASGWIDPRLISAVEAVFGLVPPVAAP